MYQPPKWSYKRPKLSIKKFYLYIIQPAHYSTHNTLCTRLLYQLYYEPQVKNIFEIDSYKNSVKFGVILTLLSTIFYTIGLFIHFELNWKYILPIAWPIIKHFSKSFTKKIFKALCFANIIESGLEVLNSKFLQSYKPKVAVPSAFGYINKQDLFYTSLYLQGSLQVIETNKSSFRHSLNWKGSLQVIEAFCRFYRMKSDGYITHAGTVTSQWFHQRGGLGFVPFTWKWNYKTLSQYRRWRGVMYYFNIFSNVNCFCKLAFSFLMWRCRMHSELWSTLESRSWLRA